MFGAAVGQYGHGGGDKFGYFRIYRCFETQLKVTSSHRYKLFPHRPDYNVTKGFVFILPGPLENYN